MKFNIYGRFQIEVMRDNDLWNAYRAGIEKRAILHDVVIPFELEPDEIAIYLDR